LSESADGQVDAASGAGKICEAQWSRGHARRFGVVIEEFGGWIREEKSLFREKGSRREFGGRW
jgi:hypothetical protein